jgi:4-azaleucine resistance transporter AzlC
MDNPNPYHLPGPGEEIAAGVAAIAPAAIAAIPIELLFGAVAAAKGLSGLEATLMSTLVFAGGAQFAALETWSHPLPVAAIAFATLLINARHVLMGASLAPKLRARNWQRCLAAFLMTDESWALAERRALSHPVTLAFWLAMGSCLCAAWVLSTAVGAVLGSFLGEPEKIGADFVFTALFIGLIAGFGRSRTTVAAVIGSSIGAALTHLFSGPPWQVAAGALSGITAAYLAAGRGTSR